MNSATAHQRPLRICLDARLLDGQAGGVQQALAGLAAGLAQLDDGDEEYLFLSFAGANDWLRPSLGGRCNLLEIPPPARGSLRGRLKAALPLIGRIGGALRRRPDPLPTSDGTVERAGADLMHFTTPLGFRTAIPSIYQPWDLQHIALPGFFPRRERERRELWYRGLCAQARLVVAASWAARDDLLRHYGVPAASITVIPPAPPVSTYAEPPPEQREAISRRLNLPAQFLLYPAQTWPHKNHLALLEAMARLRDERGLMVPVVCAGTKNDFFPTIERRVRELRLEHLALFVGFMQPPEMQTLYAHCRGVIFPSLFEGWGLPVSEAFWHGRPVACANVTSLPELAGDAALLFDPRDPVAIADAAARLWLDPALGEELVARGRRRVTGYSWADAARRFRAHYRRLAGRPLNEEDHALLASQPPLVEARP
ncbi:MAG: hypothetical protein OHK0015_47420 [Chloroflexi bacterium OHK40]